MGAIFEPHELSMLDVENLRLHYAETLRHWLSRYEQSIETVRKKYDAAVRADVADVPRRFDRRL